MIPLDTTMLDYQPSIRKLITIGGGLLLCFLLLLPPFIRWMLLGAILALAGVWLQKWLTSSSHEHDPLPPPDLTSLPQLQVPTTRRQDDNSTFSGWMNEVEVYDPAVYQIQDARSVYVELRGTELCLQTPKHGVPRGASWGEELKLPSSLVKLRTYNVQDAVVELLPEDLTLKRLWSRKFPICVHILLKGHRLSGLTSSSSQSSSLNSSPTSSRSSDVIVKLYLFGRGAREKEDWFRRFQAASTGNPLPHNALHALSEPPGEWPMNDETSRDEQTSRTRLAAYLNYMAQVMPPEVQKDWVKYRYPDIRLHRTNSHDIFHSPASCEPQLSWLNALITRCFWDCHHDMFWVDVIQKRLQNKLDKIPVPYFMEALTITSVDPGDEMPIIQRAGLPYIDEQGMWVDLDITYGGGFSMMVATKLNLNKLTRNPEDKHLLHPSPSTDSISTGPSEASDTSSGTGSDTSDDASESQEPTDADRASPKVHRRKSKRTRILRMMEKFAHSKFVHKATEYKTIKKYIDKVSNTPLVLSVTVNHVSGTLSLNIPHPPTDRLWFGFRGPPCLRLAAKPSIGEKKLGYARAVDWIEKKLVQEFQKFIVMPNMQNVPIDMMSDQPSPLNRQSEDQLVQ